MDFRRLLSGFLVALLLFLAFVPASPAYGKKKSRKRNPYSRVIHPVVLWSRTVSESTDPEQRKVAAFKLSQYTQPLYQDEVIQTLIKCMKDTDVTIKVFCAKAMSRAGTQSKTEWVRKSLIEQYRTDAQLRSTLIRTFIARKDSHSSVQETILDTAKESKDPEELLPALNYFELFGSPVFFDAAVALYEKSENPKIKRAAVKALAERGQGQDSIITILTQCTESKDTPLALTCLAGLQVQGKKDAKTWGALEKSIESSDPDVVIATLEVIQVLPETPNSAITTRLVDIIGNSDDSELLEKSLLALGVCGDFSETAVKAMQSILEKKGGDEGLRVSAALMLGKQATKFPEGPLAALSECKKSGASQSLKTACQLGLQELESRKINVSSSRSVTPATAIPSTGKTMLSKEDYQEKTSNSKNSMSSGTVSEGLEISQ